MSTQNIDTLRQHLEARVQESGFFNGFVFGYEQEINAMPEALFPMLFVLPNTPDGYMDARNIVIGKAYQQNNLKFLAWDKYTPEVAQLKSKTEIWAELELALFNFLHAAFGAEYCRDFKLLDNPQPTFKRRISKHNVELAEVELDLRCQFYFGG